MLSLSEGFRIQEGLLARRENQSRETIWDFFSGYSEGKRLERGCCQLTGMVFFEGRCSKIDSGGKCTPAHILKVIKQRVRFSPGRDSRYSWKFGAGLRVQGQKGLYIAKTKIIPVTLGNRVFLQTESTSPL